MPIPHTTMTATETINAILREKLAELHAVTPYAAIYCQLCAFRDSPEQSVHFRIYTHDERPATVADSLDDAVTAHVVAIKADTPAIKASRLREQAANLMAEAESLEA